MRPVNDEFDPLTDEELRQLQDDEEFRRRVRREVLRMQSGEADTEIEQEREQQRAEQQERNREEAKQRLRRSRLFWQLFSGNILLNRNVQEHYGYLIAIAIMCVVSIFVMFSALYADLRYSQVERELQLVRERSIRLQEQLYRRTTHQAVRDELARRGINLQDPHKPKEVVEE